MARPRLELLAGHAAVLLVQDCLNSRVCFLSSLHLSFRAEFRGAKRTRGISNCLVRAMARDYDFCIYIVPNRNHSVLYIGVTKQSYAANMQTPRRHRLELPGSLSMQDSSNG